LYSIFCKTYFSSTLDQTCLDPSLFSVTLLRVQMELVLNLFWLTLAVPALWIWRQESAYAEDCRGFDRIRPFLLLGCVLMLLFPAVSATDDLHAMRQETEESSSKRMVMQASDGKSFVGLSSPGAVPALILPVLPGPNYEICGRVLLVSSVLPQPAHFKERATRAPPLSSIGEGGGFAA
jgi:hypothetical protein